MYPELSFRLASWPDPTVAELADFAEACRAELADAERACRFPREIYAEMGRRGWVGTITPIEEGGIGGGVAEYCLVEEEAARLRLVPPQVSVQGQRWLLAWGTAEQRARYLKGIARGELIFAEAISEPGVGSSLKLMRARARRDGPDWLIDGQKVHVNLGCEADLTIVYAMADEGLTAFLVETSEPGVSSHRTEPIGLRLLPTAEIDYQDVRVPSSAVLGAPGRGLDTFLSVFNMSRLGNASALIGYGRKALADGIEYAAKRQVGDNVVTDFQGIQWTVADGYAALYAASLARDRAAKLADSGVEPAFETTIAKKLAIEAAERTVNEVFALIGGHGLYTDTPYSQLLQDVKVLRVAGGSLEVLRNYLARRVLRSPGYEGLR